MNLQPEQIGITGDLTGGRVTRWRGGEPVYASRLNRMIDAMERATRRLATPRQVTYPQQIRTQGLVLRCVVVQVLADTLRVKEAAHPGHDASELVTGDFEIAKPFTLQRTAWDGQTINGVTFTYTDHVTREEDTGSEVLTAHITPPWIAGFSEIDVLVQIGNATGIDDTAGAAIYGRDLNVDGRQWAVEASA